MHRSFGHTRVFDPDLLEKTGMDVDFARVWHAVGWDDFVLVVENGSGLLTIQFLCTLWEVDDGVCLWFFLEMNTILLGEISATSLVLMPDCQFP